MYRLYYYLPDYPGDYRYYRYKGGMWGMWSKHAEPFTLEQAKQLAQSEDCLYERI